MSSVPRPVFSSRFNSLDIQSGEDESDEEVQVDSASEDASKPSKSALKKAARTARLEKKQAEKAAARAARIISNTPPTPVAEELPEEPVYQQETLSGEDLPEPEKAAEPLFNPPTPEPVVASPPALAQPVHVPCKETVPVLAPAVVQKKEVAIAVPAKEPTAQEIESTKKRQNALTRTLWGLIMAGSFIGLLLLGHVYMILLVLFCQALVYREVTALFSLKTTVSETGVTTTNGKDPWSKTLNWYFFVATNYFLYGESIIYYFKHVVFADAQLLPFATNHRIISFTLYIIGFVGFVMSLKKGFLKQQFGLFCWVHMSLLLIVVSSHFIINNILEGLIWFFVPASLVICNDVFAYIWGITIGRTPLIKLSPKKTVEGFVGAFWSTLLFSLVWGTWFASYEYMTCPVHNLGVSAWSSISCTPNPVFVWRSLQIWEPLVACLSMLTTEPVTSLSYQTYHIHLLVLACFASLVAPFGGFFASGFKRAFNIKDFGHSIPGHGGMTDRMDCQFLMGVFVYVYHSSLIREHHVTVGSVLETIVSGLTVDEQLELIRDLKRLLEGRGIKVF